MLLDLLTFFSFRVLFLPWFRLDHPDWCVLCTTSSSIWQLWINDVPNYSLTMVTHTQEQLAEGSSYEKGATGSQIARDRKSTAPTTMPRQNTDCCSRTCRSQLVVFFRFLTSSLRVTIVSALPTKPNRHRTETSATSTHSRYVWNASTVVSGRQAAAPGGHGASRSISEKLYVVLET